MEKHPSAFVCYSWGSEEHKKWVAGLVNALRRNGVDATMDFFETQKETTNLYAMMVNNIRTKDYVIIVLTPEYAEKANELQGGVGYETSLLLPLIQNNLQKIIPIVRCSEEPSKAIPFYLEGVHYIDFSHQDDFREKFQELLHRIFQVDLLERAPLGEIPDLKPRKVEALDKVFAQETDDLIPDFRKITDADKNRFMKHSFEEIKNGLLKKMKQTKGKNPNFDFEHEDITTRKTVLKLYINRSQECAVKLWLGNVLGSGTDEIYLAYGRVVFDRDNSFNEVIECEVAEDKTLRLGMTIGMWGERKANTSSDVVREIWKNIVQFLS